MRKVALIGAGRGGATLLPILAEYNDITVVGVVDLDLNAPGILLANKINIPVYNDYIELFKYQEPDVVLNLTHDPSISEEIRKNRPNLEILGALSAKLLWDLVYERKLREDEKTRLLEKLEISNNELSDTTNYLENILKYSGDMVVTTDLNKKIVRFNHGAEDLLGYKQEEVIGLNVEKFYLNKNERKKILNALERMGSLYGYETKLVKKDGTIFDASLTLSLLKDDNGKTIGTVGITKDITDKKKLEKEILRSNKELENFVYTVSHDLQAPLRAMDGFSTLLLEEFSDSLADEGVRYVKRVIKGAGRMKNLIEDLLELSKIGSVVHPFENVAIDELLDEVLESLQFNLDKKGAEVNVAGMPVMHCDRSRINQLFSNLITNAIKYVKKGVAPRINISYKEGSDYYEFRVKDNGIGIKEEYFSKIFNLFQRLHNIDEYEGTGIGLTVVKRIVDIHNGKIWLKSKEDVGTTFCFTITKVKSTQG